jgi:hypothetical protein
MKLKIFWAGTHTDSAGNTQTFTTADLQQMAASYDTGKHEAPIVIGHPKTNDPAYGWVKTLNFENDTLYADVTQVDNDFKDLVNQGRYKKVSAAFYPPNEKTNPVPGSFYLRHVGFLGAQPPALKGQPTNIAFTEATTITFEFEENKMTTETKETSTTVDSRLRGNDKGNDNISHSHASGNPVEYAEKYAALQKLEQELRHREQELRRAESAQFVETLTAKGQVLPRQVKPMVEFLVNLQSHPAVPLEYAEEGQRIQTTGTQWFKEFLTSLPSQVEYAELAKAAEVKTPKIPETNLEKYLKMQYGEQK